LSSFDGENPNGNWTLAIRDNFAGDNGTLNNWSLNFGSKAIQSTDVPKPISRSAIAFSTLTIETIDNPGHGGDINITVNNLDINDGAGISAGNSGSGDAGNLSLHVQNLLADTFTWAGPFDLAFADGTAVSNLSSFLSNRLTLDGTLGNGGPLTGPDYLITHDLGSISGANLFHSFSEFNLAADESATFSGPDSIVNIIARVTGPNSSLIDGTIASTIPDANLFFMNPNGV